LVAADHLLAVDAEVLPLLGRARGDGQAPRDQPRHAARPGVLERQLAEVDGLALLAHLAARRTLERLGAHADDLLGDRALAPGHAPGRAEQIAEHRHVEARGLLEQQRRTALAQGAVADFGHFQHRRYRRLDALEFAALFQFADEVAQVAILHAWASQVGAQSLAPNRVIQKAAQMQRPGFPGLLGNAGITSVSWTGRIPRWSWCPSACR